MKEVMGPRVTPGTWETRLSTEHPPRPLSPLLFCGFWLSQASIRGVSLPASAGQIMQMAPEWLVWVTWPFFGPVIVAAEIPAHLGRHPTVCVCERRKAGGIGLGTVEELQGQFSTWYKKVLSVLLKAHVGSLLCWLAPTTGHVYGGRAENVQQYCRRVQIPHGCFG